ncbi:DUF805 domain-containing protein [Pseudomonas borbori]
MTQARYKIVFDGQLMPDMTLETAKDNLARLFKSDAARINSLFSGTPIAIKRDLPENEADQYLIALQKAGANARKEPDLAASLSLVETDDHRPALSADDTAASSQTMVCPKCGMQQPAAIDCSGCGVVIEKYIARQATLAATTVAAEPAPSMAPGIAASPYAPPQAKVGETLPEFGALKVFTTEGRVGRLRYLAWSLGLMLACIPVFAIAAAGFAISEVLGGLLVGVVVIAMMVVAVQIGVQRLHDIGWSGWLFLLNFIPLVGSVLALLMLVVPGTPAANRFGPPSPPNSTAVKIMAALWLLVPVLGIVAAIALPAYQQYLSRAGL